VVCLDQGERVYLGIEVFQCPLQPVFENHLVIVLALGGGHFRGDVGTEEGLPAQFFQPVECGLFDEGFGETAAHSVSVPSWRSLREWPLLSFHSVRPFVERPRITPPAVDGELNV